MKTTVAGLAVSHQVITPICRANRSDAGAIEEAIARTARAYERYVGAEANAEVNWHLVLTREEAPPA